MQANPIQVARIIHDRLPLPRNVYFGKFMKNYNDYEGDPTITTIRRVVESITDSFLAAIDTAAQSIGDFVVLFPFAFSNRTIETIRSKLQLYAQRSRARFNELLTVLKIKKRIKIVENSACSIFDRITIRGVTLPLL